MIDAIVASPSSPCPNFARMYQDQNDDTLTDYSLFHLGNPSIYNLESHKHHEKMKDMVEDMAP
jgi:hypothetical protein